MVKNLPAMQETWVRTLGQEDCLEKGMVPTSVLLPGEVHGPKKPGRLQSMRSDMTEQLIHTQDILIISLQFLSRPGLVCM